MKSYDIEAPYRRKDLSSRVPADHHIYRVSRSTRGLVVVYPAGRSTRGPVSSRWGRTMQPHDAQDLHQAIEIRNSHGKIVAGITWERYSKSIATFGTWVAGRYRRRGLAGALWRAMLALTRPQTVRTSAVSHAGWTLIQSLKEKRLGVRFRVNPNISFRGVRIKPQDLRK